MHLHRREKGTVLTGICVPRREKSRWREYMNVREVAESGMENI